MPKTQLRNILAGHPIAETLLIPLCYRAVEAKQTQPLVQDPYAQEIIDQLGIDPNHLKWRASQQLFTMLRARQFDRWTKAYLATHPHTTVVEIGCGLDSRFERVEDGQVQWVDLDLPEVIAVRRQFFRDTNRRQMLSHSVFNLDWMDCLPVTRSYLFLAEGVFPYFEEAEVKRVFIALIERFSGAEMVVDVLSPWMVQASAVVPTFRGYQARPRWGVADPQAIQSWVRGITLVDTYGYFDHPEPRLASIQWMERIPSFRDSAHVLRLRLGLSSEFSD